MRQVNSVIEIANAFKDSVIIKLVLVCAHSSDQMEILVRKIMSV